MDPQTGKVKRKVGRPSKAQKAAEADAAKQLADAQSERETAAFESEFAKYIESVRDHWRNGDGLVFLPEPPDTHPLQQVWSLNPIPIPQEVAARYLDRVWNVTLDGSQVGTPPQAGENVLPRVFPLAEPFQVLSNSKLLVHAYDVDLSEETLFEDLDFGSDGDEVVGTGGGNEKRKGKEKEGTCEGARFDGFL